MPYMIDFEPRGTCKRFHGFVSFAEFIRSAEEVQAAPNFDAFLYTINDFTGVTGFDVDPSHVEHVAALTTGSRYTNDRIAIVVVAADPRIRALVEHFRDSSPRVAQTRMFDTLDAARAWVQAQVGA